jgi:PAS domain S-box-containing protein
MVEQANDVIYTHDLEGNLHWVNERAIAVYGYTPDEIPGLNINEIIDPAHLPAAWEHLAGRVRDPHTKRPIELLTRAKDGRAIWIEVNTRLVSENGRPVAIQGIARDITRRKAAEEALRESEEFLRLIVSSAPIVLFALDRDGLFARSEGKGLAALGLRPGELVGRSVWEVHRDEPAILDNVRRALGGESFTSIVEARGATLDAWYLPLRGADGEVTGVVGVAVDITDRKKAEEALRASEEHLRQIQKLDAVGRLAGGVAHDFNNILTVISGYCEFLVSRFEEGDPNREDVEEIRRAAERAAVLTRQLLAFGRKQMLKPKVLDLNEIISGMAKVLRDVLGDRVELRTILAPDLGRVSADPGQIQQVIMNLAVNAGDAMPDGGTLTIETKNVELSAAHATWKITAAPGPYAMVAVSDTGRGIDPGLRDRIFEPFFTTKEKGAGSGLGLSTAYGIVKQSGGYIWVYSEPDRGTTFKVYLPRIDGGDAAEPARAAEPLPAQATGTILLVEDEDGVRALVRETLRRAGYSVLEAASGPEGLEAAGRHEGKIDLMVTDVVMPQMSGRELAERMAALRPETRVLYVSGYTENAISRHGVLDEGVAFLGKPFTPDELTRTVRGLLGTEHG